MHVPPLLAWGALATRATLDLTTYLPACAGPCLESTLNSTKICDSTTDATCLCANFLQIVFPSRQCFVTSCGDDENDVRSQITSGWQNFCNASGKSVEYSNPAGWGGGGYGGPPATATTTLTSITSPTTTPAPSVPPSSSTSIPTSSGSSISAPLTTPTDTPSGAVRASLSTGAKAGIGVGAGLGALAVIMAFIFLGFRMGHRRGQKAAGVADAGNDGENQQHMQSSPKGGLEAGLHESPSPDGGFYEKQKTPPVAVGGARAAELDSSQSTGSGAELATHERPAELWHGIMPAELSPDAEVPRDRFMSLKNVQE